MPGPASGESLRGAIVVALIALGAGACPRAGLDQAPRPSAGLDAGVEVGPEAGSERGGSKVPETAPISADPVLARAVEIARTDSQVASFVTALAADIGPRLTGTAQSVEAELWAVDQLESWGLDARRVAWGELPVGFERGKIEGTVIRPARVELELGSNAWTPGTRGLEGLEAGGPIRGQALRYPLDAAALRASTPYLRDAWLLVGHGVELPRGTLGRQIELALERAPIAGIVHAAGPPDDDRILTGGDHRLDPNQLPTRVEVLLRGDQFQALLDQLDAGTYVELEIAVGHRLLRRPVPVHNVVARLEGRERADEQVILGAHLDSWDGGRGAIDNATGVATTLEAARILAQACAETKQRPRRTIAFHLWTGEEQGLLGSSAWVEANRDALADISAVLVHDNGTNYLSGLSVTPELHGPLVAALEPLTRLDPEAMPFALELVESLPFEPTDSSSFLRAGVPSFFWHQQGRSNYARYHHTQFDAPDAVIDDYQRHSALVVAIAAWQLANLPELLPRDNLVALAPRRLGVVLDGTEVTEVAEGSLAAELGLMPGDRIIEVEGERVATSEALIALLQRGGAQKQLVVERRTEPGAAPERIEQIADWGRDPVEAERRARVEGRRAKFEAQLLPWDDQADATREQSPQD